MHTHTHSMAKMTDLEENLQLSVRQKVAMCKGARRIYKTGKHYITLYGFQKKILAFHAPGAPTLLMHTHVCAYAC